MSLLLKNMNTRHSSRTPAHSLARNSQPRGTTIVPRRRVQRQYRHQKARHVIATEAIAKLCVNSVVAIVALVALVRLVSYNVAQRDKLQLLDTEVQASQKQLAAERDDFQYHFDPKQARNIMQEQSYRVEPGQAQIVFSPSVQSSGSSTVDIRASDSPSPASLQEESPMRTLPSEANGSVSREMTQDPSSFNTQPNSAIDSRSYQTPSEPASASETTSRTVETREPAIAP